MIWTVDIRSKKSCFQFSRCATKAHQKMLSCLFHMDIYRPQNNDALLSYQQRVEKNGNDVKKPISFCFFFLEWQWVVTKSNKTMSVGRNVFSSLTTIWSSWGYTFDLNLKRGRWTLDIYFIPRFEGQSTRRDFLGKISSIIIMLLTTRERREKRIIFLNIF